MKPNFLKFAKKIQSGLFLPVVLAAVIFAPLMALGTQSIAIFTGNITSPPNVDATNFYNSGTWTIGTPIYPYKTAHTLNYTNVGTMLGSVGWEFDYGLSSSGPPSGRGMSASFFNDSRGTIEAIDGTIANPVYATWLGSYIWISATNVVNKGVLAGGAGGEIVLNGVNINLRRSAVEIGTIAPQGSPTNPTNFVPDTAIYDENWGITNTFPNSTVPYGFDSFAIWNGAASTTPVFYLNGLCQSVNRGFQFGFTPSLADSTNIESLLYMTNIVFTNIDLNLTNVILPTKIFRQAVFVYVRDSNIIAEDGYFPNSNDRSNLYQTVTVKLTSTLSGNSIYLADTLGALTNSRSLALNLNGNIGDNPLSTCTDPTYRPANYIMSRLDPGTFASSVTGLGAPPADFFYNDAFTNEFVTALYAGYEGYVDDLVRHPFGMDVTNLPGRIIVNATNLDLTQATLSSQGAEIAIHAANFIGSTNAVVSCQNLSFNLGSAVGHVNVTNLVTHVSVPGLNGSITAWSALWTNGLITGIFTNYFYVTNTVGTNTVGVLTNTVITNISEVDFHVLMEDANQLSTTVPVRVQDLILQTNSVISDSMSVIHTFLFNGQSLTLLGTLNLSGPNLQNWNSFLAPSLLYFTNNGTLSIPQNAYFGSDQATNYAAFVNNGRITVGGSETINSVFYQSDGNENAPGGYFVTASDGKVQNAGITSGQDMNFTGGLLKLDHSILSAGNQLNFTLTNALYDSGGSANNMLTCGDGFNLWAKPTTGDLLGTALTSQAFYGAEVDSVWAGEDRGATGAGYTNNVALGQLILSPQGTSYFPALFYFSGAGAANAMYVDLLDLSQITNLTEMLATDPNLVIYYAAAKLPTSITVLSGNGTPQQMVETNNSLNGQSYYVVANGGSGQVAREAEEVLNGQLNGHLRWVSGFAGPNSSVDVIINGQTYAVNRALRYSLSIDSNGNGTPNGLDANPFNTPPAGSAPALVLSVHMAPLPGQQSGSTIQSTQPSSSVPALSWVASPGTVYQVQYSTTLSPAAWLPLLNYTNTASTNIDVTIWDTNAVSGARFYRLSRP